MTHFTETAPGVHTATLTNPKSGHYYNIAVIESSGAWQLFIDGELRVRDLPSFEEAVATAKANVLTLHRSSRMVRIAGALSVLMVLGGASVWASSIIGGALSPEATASVETKVTSKLRDTAFTRVTPSTPPAPVAPVILNRTPPAPSNPEAAAEPAKSQPRRFSAETPLFAPAPSPAADTVETVIIQSTSASRLAPKTFEAAEPAGANEVTPLAPTARTASAQPVSDPEPQSEPAPATADLLPPTPSAAVETRTTNLYGPATGQRAETVTAPPVIRSASAPVDRDLLKEIDEREAAPSPQHSDRAPRSSDVVDDDQRPKRVRTIDNAQGARRRIERRNREAARRKARREEDRRDRHRDRREARADRYHTAATTDRHTRRVVCFAHTCKLR